MIFEATPRIKTLYEDIINRQELKRLIRIITSVGIMDADARIIAETPHNVASKV